jgi:Fur family transcriptional regulator, zinc uptake regulator
MAASQSRFSESRRKHDHQRCITRALSVAEKVCNERELQFTAIRRRVLEIIWQRHAPIGAYDILSALKKNDGALAPPTVYRALEFLLEAGLIHRIDTLNAFIGCELPQEPHAGQFLVCRECSRVTELDDPSIGRLLAQKATAAGFAADAQSVEIKGVCKLCISKSSQ